MCQLIIISLGAEVRYRSRATSHLRASKHASATLRLSGTVCVPSLSAEVCVTSLSYGLCYVELCYTVVQS